MWLRERAKRSGSVEPDEGEVVGESEDEDEEGEAVRAGLDAVGSQEFHAFCACE